MIKPSSIFLAALVILGGSLLFILGSDPATPVVAEQARGTQKSSSAARHSPGQNESRSSIPSSARVSNRIAVAESAIEHLNQRDRLRVASILNEIQRDSHAYLDELARNYQITPEQRRNLFPVVVAHHQQAHPAMLLNGQPLPQINPASSLEENIAPYLDPSQQDALADDTADREAWWTEIVSQLEDDLDSAIDQGEMVPAPDNQGAAGITLSDQAADGDGEASSHSGGNLFDLLKR